MLPGESIITFCADALAAEFEFANQLTEIEQSIDNLLQYVYLYKNFSVKNNICIVGKFFVYYQLSKSSGEIAEKIGKGNFQ